jgi:hypothetical protein
MVVAMTKLGTIALLTAIIFLLTALCSSLAIECPSARAYLIVPPPTPIATYSYVLSNLYSVNYSIYQMPPPDRDSVSYVPYNLVIYGPLPFPIQISFYEQTTGNINQKSSGIMPAHAFSSTFACASYPTQITIMQVGTESLSPIPTMSTSPILTPNPTSILAPKESLTPTPSPVLTPTPTQVIVQSVQTWFFAIIVGLVAVIAVLLGAIVLMLKQKQKTNT